jgi:hypothetical protein
MFSANIYAQKPLVDLLLPNAKQGLTKNSLNSLDKFGINLVEGHHRVVRVDLISK